MVKEVSLLISTYNWPEALELCLDSVLRQTVLPKEILIADDGSKEETRKFIEAFRAKTNIHVKHVWHEDDGFRKTIILNEAIRLGSYDYIIQTDGDIILHPNFIEDHLTRATPGYFVRGSRCMINESRTKELITSRNSDVKWNDKGVVNKFNALRSPVLSALFSLANNKHSIDGVKGCNFSFWKSDFIKVNGFNNDIVGWGREDSELAIRLINAGVFKLHLKFKAVCFHLHHNIFSRDRDEKNMQMLAEATKNKTQFAPNGYSKVYPAQLLS